MAILFDALRAPDLALAPLDPGVLAPENPYASLRYAAARCAGGEHAWVLSLVDGAETLNACFAFERRGRINRSLEIPSLPPLADAASFWTGLTQLCRRETLSVLEVNTFASPETIIPRLPGLVSHEPRREFVVHLDGYGGDKSLATNHRRNIERARGAGLSLRRTTDRDACAIHASLIGASLHRRSVRGDHVSTRVDDAPFRLYLEHGAGELMQAVRCEEVLASLLILRGTAGAYYQSAGTSVDGMSCGASPFVIHETTELLRREGARVFNLGGAGDDNPGLQRFKRGFGAREVPLERAEFFVGGAVRRRLGTAAGYVRGRVATLRGRSG